LRPLSLASVEMKRLLPTLVGLALLGALSWMCPPFHIRSLKAVRAVAEDQQFNAADFASSFWEEQLLPAVEQASDAAAVLERITADPKSVREQFGRTVGVSSSYYLFLRGQGRVVSADENSIGLRLTPDGDEAQIVIELGFVFGNAVRDATGLISAGHYPNAQEYNDISAALNGIVETNVLPQLQKIAQVGSRIRFAGCVEAEDEEVDLQPLKLVPVLITGDRN